MGDSGRASAWSRDRGTGERATPRPPGGSEWRAPWDDCAGYILVVEIFRKKSFYDLLQKLDVKVYKICLCESSYLENLSYTPKQHPKSSKSSFKLNFPSRSHSWKQIVLFQLLPFDLTPKTKVKTNSALVKTNRVKQNNLLSGVKYKTTCVQDGYSYLP